jgi:hypothetical protein
VVCNSFDLRRPTAVPSSAAIDTRERSGKLRGILWRQILTGKEKVAVNILAGNKKKQ